jgi:hypothetical protein
MFCDRKTTSLLGGVSSERFETDKSFAFPTSSCIGHIINVAVQTFLKQGLSSEPLQNVDDAFNAKNM